MQDKLRELITGLDSHLDPKHHIKAEYESFVHS